ncbi:TolC family protein [Pedobacter montanisoli]|uniref:TolC family protein n=1 Tax=Pedobacter montanisoli TaxID=2923277 RepID=A0ABS9ZU28_9SPHI|nr:TolC family protein [Pedobacter montanisoli]MCJ0741429.1 TolC family protein [Pedobacter montanisoli]
MKNKQIIFLVSLIFILMQQKLFAQNVLSLKDAIQITLQNNYDIKLVKNDLEISKNNATLGNSGMLPTATGNFGTGGSIQNTVQTQSTGTQRVTDGAKNSNLTYGIGLDWTIFDGFKMFASYDKFKALEKQGETNLKIQILNSIADVVAAYYNIVKQQQQVMVADSSLDISNMRLRIAQNKLKIGKGSKLDVLSATVDYNADTSNYLQQKNLLNNYKIALNSLLARETNTSFTVNSEIDLEATLNYNELTTQAEQLSPALQNALINKKIAELSLKQVYANRYPKISVNGGYDFNRSQSPTGFNTQFRSNGFSYGLTASLNLFNGFVQRQNERNAKVEINSSQLQIDKTKQDILTKLASAYQDYITFLDLIKLEKNNLDIAKQNLDITLEKYRLGSITPLELREAQKNELDANNRFLETKYQAKLAELSLKQISGTLNLN